jgi:formate-nitrite transporter family protein
MTDDDEQARLSIPVSDSDHVEGAGEAPVTLVEYGDFECPHCGQAYPIVKEIQKRLGGRLRFVFRNFPLTQSHPHAERAAEAAEAAAAQGKFWQMHDLLYQHQQALKDEDLGRYAEDLGLDAERVKTELRQGTYRERVRQNFMSGVRSGVNGTPTFFINGVRHDGSYDLSTLLGAIERAGQAAGSGDAG